MDNLIEFFRIVRKLKDVKRTGWVEREVKDPESIADHSFMTALMCMVMPAKEIDRDRAIRMALVHDIAEAEIGDIITKENWEGGGTMTRDDKAKLEEKALRKLLSSIGRGIGAEILSLWKEFEEGNTPEAVFVKDADVAERLMQAHNYHDEGNFKKPMHPFWDGRSMGKIRDGNIKKLVKDIIAKGQ